MSTIAFARQPHDSYFNLIRVYPLRPLRSVAEFDRAMAVLLTLEKSKTVEEMDAGERDYIEALAMFLREFERGRQYSSLPKLTPIDRLKFLMDEQAMTVNEIGKILGSQPTASLILYGKRAMSKAHILKLSEHFRVSPALFLK